jgi:hypothetical protein
MKALFAALVSLAIFTPQLASAFPICGEVVLGMCDVDYCDFKFAVRLADGTYDRYGLKADGEYLNRDFEVYGQGLEKLEGLKACIDDTDVDSIGAVDVTKLVPQP